MVVTGNLRRMLAGGGLRRGEIPVDGGRANHRSGDGIRGKSYQGERQHGAADYDRDRLNWQTIVWQC